MQNVVIIVKGTVHPFVHEIEKLGFRFGRKERGYYKIVDREKQDPIELLNIVKKKAKDNKIEVYIVEPVSDKDKLAKLKDAMDPCPNCPTGLIKNAAYGPLYVEGSCITCKKTVKMNAQWFTKKELQVIHNINNISIEFEK